MNRRFTLSVAFVPGKILISLKNGSGAPVQQKGISAASVGTMLLPYQAVRVGIAGDFNADGDTSGADLLSFKSVGFIATDDLFQFSAQPAPLTLAVGETASLGLLAGTYGRGIVLTKSGEAQVIRSTQVASVYHKITWFGSPDTRAKVRFIEKTPSQIIGILIAL
jgi:hypothetical protein